MKPSNEELLAEIERLRALRSAWQGLARMLDLEHDNERAVYDLIRQQVHELNAEIGAYRMRLDEGWVIA